MKFLQKRTKRSDQTSGRRRSTDLDRHGPQVFSYHANRSLNEVNTGRSQENVERAHTSRIDSILGSRALRRVLGILVIGLLLNQLFLGTNPEVVVLSSASSEVFLRNTSTYNQAAVQLLRSRMSNRDKLTINTAAISAAMKAQFPELSDVSVKLPLFGSRATVYVQPSEPSFILRASNGIFVLDNSGRALTAIGATKAPRLHVPIILDQSGLQVKTGGIALPGNDVAFIHKVVTELEAQHSNIQQINLPPVASEVDVHLSGKAYFAKFNMQDQAGVLQQVGDFIATANSLAAKGTPPVQYIDVRIDGRAYYK